jgi:hypothetical protein
MEMSKHWRQSGMDWIFRRTPPSARDRGRGGSCSGLAAATTLGFLAYKCWMSAFRAVSNAGCSFCESLHKLADLSRRFVDLIAGSRTRLWLVSGWGCRVGVFAQRVRKSAKETRMLGERIIAAAQTPARAPENENRIGSHRTQDPHLCRNRSLPHPLHTLFVTTELLVLSV